MQFCFFQHHTSKLTTLKYFLLLLLLPIISTAQTNEDYIRLVKKVDTPRTYFSLPNSSANRDQMQVQGDLSYPASTRRITVGRNQIFVISRARSLTFSGNFTTSAALSWANRLPALQQQYAQGLNNQYIGPETGTLFSYGPAISTLEYDGSHYAWDNNGQLVMKGSGNGKAANVYNNSILRTGMAVTNDISVKVSYFALRGQPWDLYLKAGQENDKSIISQNDNLHQHGGLALSHEMNNNKLTLKYDYGVDRFDYANRNRLLNRVYQYSLLTPVSFQNEQGTMIGNTQRSYSNGADNPLFLLQDHDNDYARRFHNASFKLENNTGRISYSLAPSIQANRTNNTEAYAPGTTGFTNGNITRRQQNDLTFQTRGNVRFELPTILNKQTYSWINLSYDYVNVHTDIRYLGLLPEYKYKRITHEPILSYSTGLRTYSGWEFNMDLGNKVYISNTADKQSYWLPLAALSAKKSMKIGSKWSSAKLTSKLHHFNSELPINQSVAAINLFNYSTTTATGFLPIMEASRFTGLRPVYHREWSNDLEVNYGTFNLNASYYIRATRHDVLPVISNNTILLQNVADHVTKGLEIQLAHGNRFRIGGKTINYRNSLSLSTYKNRIQSVTDGYNYTPTAGFSDVYTAIVAGAPSNVIVGSAYLRDANHQIVTGTDGNPVVDPQLRVLGNPNPEFMLGMSNYLSYKSLSLNLSWMWEKGGEKWNGTAAMLDYYGRSASSAAQRKSETTPQTPVAENYIARADFIRINNISVSLDHSFRGYVNKLKVTAFVRNLLIWTPYKGVDPDQSLLEPGNTTGLDFFNLPATTNAGIEASISF